ncbi:oxidoreductase [Actinomadura sp. NBRC 104412]|uniref:nitroreductase family protein n=1 Tax=Actinomadura sp. NBRC 104412 TaxID=3032203 RepID=UPI0024A07499|nr:nitroreductase family protein [Actinomadura sp. NBRC 104412]GLZ06275.1 oxidoreductase [Actinomadura sp. NBRC 104412]
MDVIQALKTTGTCRYFDTAPVPDEILLDAFDAARFSPQGGNRQPVRWVVVRDPEKKRRLRDWYLEPWKAYLAGIESGDVAVGALPKAVVDADHFAEHLHEVPAIAVLCAELDGLHPTDLELDRLSVVGGGSIYPTAQSFCLALRSHGVATAVTTLLCHYEPQVKELLGIPDGVITAAHIAVGYPARGFPAKLSRLPVEQIAFGETYGTPLKQS